MRTLETFRSRRLSENRFWRGIVVDGKHQVGDVSALTRHVKPRAGFYKLHLANSAFEHIRPMHTVVTKLVPLTTAWSNSEQTPGR